MNTPKTRPCRPGDVLTSATVPCGAYCKVVVDHPSPHPSSGTTDDYSVDVSLIIGIPAQQNGNITPSLRTGAVVAKETLGSGWGNLAGTNRIRCERFSGTSIVNLVSEASAKGLEAIKAIQAIADEHAASRAAQESARTAAYAEWLVADEG